MIDSCLCTIPLEFNLENDQIFHLYIDKLGQWTFCTFSVAFFYLNSFFDVLNVFALSDRSVPSVSFIFVSILCHFLNERTCFDSSMVVGKNHFNHRHCVICTHDCPRIIGLFEKNIVTALLQLRIGKKILSKKFDWSNSRCEMCKIQGYMFV